MNPFKRIATLFLIIVLTCAYADALAIPTQTFDDFAGEYGAFYGYDIDAHSLKMDVRGQALDVAIAVKGVYFDGDILIVGWQTENLLPESTAQVLYTEVLVDGERMHAEEDHPTVCWTPQVFSIHVAGDPIDGLMRGARIDTSSLDPGGTVEVTARFVVRRPLQPIALVDSEMETVFASYNQDDYASMIEALLASGVTIAGEAQMDPQAWQEDGYFVVNHLGYYYIDGEYYSEMDIGEIATLMQMQTDAEAVPPVMAREEIELIFTVDLDALRAH